MVKHSENIPAGGISSILKALKHFNGDGGRCVRGASRTSQRRGSHCPMATALLNSDVNGGTVARVSARPLLEAAMIPPKPANEKKRLEVLRGYEILDTEPETAFDDLTLIASYVCQTPIALISLIDADRQWFKSKVGVSVTETSRDVAFCASAILQSDLFIVPDASQDERFANNPLVEAQKATSR